MRPRLIGPLVVLVAVAGCIGGPAAPGTTPTGSTPGSPGTPAAAYEAYVFDHAGVESAAIEGGIRYPENGATTRKRYVTLVTSPDEAERFDPSVLDAGARAFVENTSFEESYLVVVQEYPASSSPDYRVERVERSGERVHLFLNDSSMGGTADITVETVIVRVRGSPPERAVVTTEEGVTVDSEDGIVVDRSTPEPTPTPVPLPYASENDSRNLEEPRDVHVVNRGNVTNGYRVVVEHARTPACREETPPCGAPTEHVAILDRLGKLRPGAERTIRDVIAMRGTYSVTVEASLPGEDGSRRTVRESVTWHAGAGDLRIRLADSSLSVETVPPAGDG